MTTTVINATEYRDLPLSQLNESQTNPRRVFDDAALKELAASIRSQGVLSPLLIRPLTENGFEIVAGARRYRAAQMAEVPTVPVRIVHLSDTEVFGSAACREPDSRRNSPDGRGRRLRAIARAGGAEVPASSRSARGSASRPPLSPLD